MTIKSALLCRLLAPVVLSAATATHGGAQIANMQMQEASSHGYLVLRDSAGKAIAAGELTQTERRGRVTAHLVFRFKDGSLDDETTVYKQNGSFHLISDRHIQKGPSFPEPLDASIETEKREVWLRPDGKPAQLKTMDLPADLCNGLVLTWIRHLRPEVAPVEMPYLAETSSPRLVKVVITRVDDSRFRIGAFSYSAKHYVIKVKLGGVTGLVAPMVGKQPADSDVWVSVGPVPSVVRVDAALFQGGPIWSIQLATPQW